MNFLGVDPGWSGCAAIVNENGLIVRGVTFKDLSEYDIIEVLDRFAKESDRAAIEYVGGRQQQGVTNAFRFGENYGLCRCILNQNFEDFWNPPPKQWMTDLGCLSGGDKGVLVAKAEQLWPNTKFTKTGKRGYADAALIAEWLRRKTYIPSESDEVSF